MYLRRISRFSCAVLTMGALVTAGCGGAETPVEKTETTSSTVSAPEPEKEPEKVASEETAPAEPAAASQPEASPPPGVILPEPDDGKKVDGPKLP
jgi:hypothetical protein